MRGKVFFPFLIPFFGCGSLFLTFGTITSGRLASISMCTIEPGYDTGIVLGYLGMGGHSGVYWTTFGFSGTV